MQVRGRPGGAVRALVEDATADELVRVVRVLAEARCAIAGDTSGRRDAGSGASLARHPVASEFPVGSHGLASPLRSGEQEGGRSVRAVRLRRRVSVRTPSWRSWRGSFPRFGVARGGWLASELPVRGHAHLRFAKKAPRRCGAGEQVTDAGAVASGRRRPRPSQRGTGAAALGLRGAPAGGRVGAGGATMSHQTRPSSSSR